MPPWVKCVLRACRQLKRGFEVLAPQKPHGGFSTAPMPSKHISPSANTSNPLFNCPHALKCVFEGMGAVEKGVSGAPMGEKHI